MFFSLTADELKDICDVRVCLEVPALKSSFRKNPQALKDTLEDIVDLMKKMRNRGKDAEYLDLDTRFHQALFDCSGNRFLNDAFQTISHKMAALRNRLGSHPDHMDKSFSEHVEILSRIKDDALDEAVDILINHIGRKDGSYWKLATESNSMH